MKRFASQPRGGGFGLGVGGAEGLAEGLDDGEIGVCIELVCDVEGGADFDVFLREVAGVDDDYADLIGVFGILAVVALVTLFREMTNSPEEAGVGVCVDDAKGGGQRCGFWVGRVAVPFAIGAFPEEVPDILAADIRHLGDGLLGVLAGTIESRAHDEKLDGLVGEALTLADLVAQMQGRTAVRPQVLLQGERVLCDFAVGEGHDGK